MRTRTIDRKQWPQLFCVDRTVFMSYVLRKSKQVTMRDNVIKSMFWDGLEGDQEGLHSLGFKWKYILLWAIKWQVLFIRLDSVFLYICFLLPNLSNQCWDRNSFKKKHLFSKS